MSSSEVTFGVYRDLDRISNCLLWLLFMEFMNISWAHERVLNEWLRKEKRNKKR